MTVSNLKVSYDESTILENINFSIKKHLCILGSNGSGKSTLAKALCGLLPYQGSIQIGTDELASLPALQRAKEIAYIPSKMESFEQFTTVEEFVLLGRYPHKASFKNYSIEDKSIVKEVLTELSLSELAPLKLHALSSGQQQLVLIAQALAQKSNILIFDEPTSNLDPKNTALFVKELKKLRTSFTTILITHDIQLAAFFNDPVVFIQDKKAALYETGFFQTEHLSRAYGINFKNENGLLGVAYE
jgi:ABC-type cobalamin/Fe3+-siderophores transport system ATPase subunit